jgi:hypothetical protein
MDEEEDGESMEASIQDHNEKENQKQIMSRCSVKKLYKLMDEFGDEKKALVTEMGFGGILEIPYVEKSSRVFSMWILSHVDEAASAISNGNRRDVQFYAQDFGKVLGIPAGGTAIGSHPDADVVATVRKILGITDSETSILAIEEIVKKNYKKPMTKKQSDRFKVAFCICIVTYLLSPQLKGNHFWTGYWGALHTPELIPMYDWGKLVHEGILASARRVKSELVGTMKKKSNITGCTYGLQVRIVAYLLIYTYHGKQITLYCKVNIMRN